MGFLIALLKTLRRFKLDKPINKLQDALNPSTLGILWLTEPNITPQIPLFSELDYFLNGALSDYYLNTKKKTDTKVSKNLFVTHHFNNTFFVGHLFGNSKGHNKNLDELIELVIPLRNQTNRREILVIDHSNKDMLRHIQKSYDQFDFKAIGKLIS